MWKPTKVLLLLLAPAALYAALSVSTLSVVPTQASLLIRDYVGPCTINVREGSATGPLHPDLTDAVDTSRPDTMTWLDGTRVVTMGHQRANLALAADTEYFGTISVCGTATFTFRTANLPQGVTMPQPIPFNAAAWAKTDFPAIDWSPAGTGKWYTDPLTGVKLKILGNTEDFSWAYQANVSFDLWAGGSGWTAPESVITGSASTATTSGVSPLFLFPRPKNIWNTDQTAPDNFAALLYAQCVTGTGADCQFRVGMSLHPDEGFYGTPITLTAPGTMGLVSGGSTHTVAGGGYPTTYPSPNFNGWGAVIRRDQMISSSTLRASTFAAGAITIAAPTASGISASQPGHIPTSARTGQYVYVPDAADACTANGPDICTAATVSHAGAMTLSQPVTPRARLSFGSGNGSVTYQAVAGGAAGIVVTARQIQAGNSTPLSVVVAGNAITINLATNAGGTRISTATEVKAAVEASAEAAALVTVVAGGTGAGVTGENGIATPLFMGFVPLTWGIRIEKLTATGTLRIGAVYRASGQRSSVTGTSGVRCHPLERTDPDGVKGHACMVPVAGGYDHLYFVSNDGEINRPITGFFDPGTAGPHSNATFSPSDPAVFYASHASGIRKGVYAGNWKDTPWDDEGNKYRINEGGSFPSGGALINDFFTWTTAVTNTAAKVNAQYPLQTTGGYAAWPASAAFCGISGDLGCQYRIGAGGSIGDTGPCQMAIFNLVSNTLVDFINTVEQGDGGPLAFGNCHSVGPGIVPNSFNMTLNRLPNGTGFPGNTSNLSNGPYAVPVEAILAPDGATWSNSITLASPRVTAVHYSECPADTPAGLLFTGAVPGSGKCITFKMSGHTCNYYPKGTADPATFDFAIFGSCAWNGAYAAGPLIRPGHNFINKYTSNSPGPSGPVDGDSEHFRVLKVENLTGADAGKVKVWAEWNAMRDYCCMAGTTNGYGCVCSTAQSTHPAPSTGYWVAIFMPGTKGTCTSANVTAVWDDPTASLKRYFENSKSMGGHSTLGSAPNGKLRFAGIGGALDLNTIEDMSQQPPIVSKLRVNNTIFQGVPAPIGSSYQAYINHSHSKASDYDKSFSFDANSINPSSGTGGNLFSNGVGSRTITAVTGDIYRTTLAMGTVAYKIRPLLGWAGRANMKEISGPGSSIAAAADFSFCYVYLAGECYASSTVGQIYMKVPQAYTTGTLCPTGLELAYAPCVISAGPAASYGRQWRSGIADVDGSDQRLLTTGLRQFGGHFPYWGLVAHQAGKIAFMPSGGTLEGVRHAHWIIRLPPFPDSTEKQARLGGFRVSLPPLTGMTHARVRFGYTTTYACTERAEACVTDSAMNTITDPFAFALSDTLTNFACSAVAGCSISVPVRPGRLFYYRVETYNGSAWTSGETLTGSVR